MIFTDETKMNCSCSNERNWCWLCEKNLSKHIVKQTMKHEEGSMMLWSCLMAREVDSLYKIEKTMVYATLNCCKKNCTLLDLDLDL